jgi:hypothetical protein
MTSMVLPHTNGSTSGSTASHADSIDNVWLRQTVRQFFGNFNWNDNPPEVEELRQTTSNGQQPLSMTLTVKQFFSAIDWDGNAIAAIPPTEQPPTLNPADAFTLEDFSDLF